MSLYTAIKFRHLTDQLTVTETAQFVNTLLHRPNNIIIKALFNHFVDSAKNTNVQHEAKSVTKLISNIIESREKKPKRISPQNIKLNQFPKPLIGVISSFLDQSDYINFSKTSRAIFVGSHSPNLLQKLDLKNIKNYSSVNLASFPSIKTLKLNLNKFNELITSMTASSMLNELQSISLYGEEKSDIDIDGFMQQNNINISDVTKLELLHFGTRRNPFPSSKITKIMAKFSNIQYLSLHDVDSNIDINDIKQRCSNLKGLEIECNAETIQRSIVHEFGNKLEFLQIGHIQRIDYNVSNVNFGRLQELNLFLPTNKMMTNILKTAVNLQKIYFVLEFANKSFMKPTEIQETIINIIKSCKSLEYIGVYGDAKLIESILKGIEMGLFETKERKRKEIKIQIDMDCADQLKPNDIMSNIRNIINCLKSSEINDFMFILYVITMDTKFDINGMMKELQDLATDINVKRSYSKFIITNKNYNINKKDMKHNG